MLAEPTNLRIALWIVLLAILLPVGSALLLLTHMVEFLIRPEVLVVAGVIHKGLPTLAGSLFVGGSVIRVGIGLTTFRPNRMYPQKGGTPYRLAIAWGASHVYHRTELEEGIQGQEISNDSHQRGSWVWELQNGHGRPGRRPGGRRALGRRRR